MVTDLDRAYATCATLARRHYENFPVASLLLPRATRPHIAAVYAFARVADDLADEGDRPAAERLALLDAWRARLRAATEVSRNEGTPGGPEVPHHIGEPEGPHHIGEAAAGEGPLPPGLPAETPEIFAAVGSTIRNCRLQVGLFDDLLSAFCQDVTTTRYQTWDSVYDYCRRSANPVGRLVLAIAGYRDERLERSSDALCTALQLTNFWQDLARDWQKGRLYLPLDECRREGADTADLDAGRLTEPWRRVAAGAAQRTAALFEQGREVCDGVNGRLKFELRFTWLGGRRILARVEACGFDVFRGRPALGAADLPGILWQAAAWRSR